MKTLIELTAEYYALISGEHHKDKDFQKCNCKVFEEYLKPEIRFTHKIGFVTQEEIEKNRHNIKVFLNTHRVV